MSERFTLLVDGDEVYCRDNQGYGFNYPMYDESSAKDMIKLLNELYGENEQLKQSNSLLADMADKYQKLWHEVDEENEQLKAELEFWKKQAKQCPMRSCKND